MVIFCALLKIICSTIVFWYVSFADSIFADSILGEFTVQNSEIKFPVVRRAIGHILGKESAKVLEFNSIAIVYCPSEKVFIATLIKDQWVVTTYQKAKSCYNKGIGKMRIVFGENHLEEFEGNEKVFYAERIVTHPDGELADNDIALIKLKNKVDTFKCHKKIQPTILPKDNQTIPRNYDCISAGWGQEFKYLQKGEIRFDRKFKSGGNYTICTDNCGLQTNEDLRKDRPRIEECKNFLNYGSPVFCLIDGKLKIMGITSEISDGCNENHKNKFTQISFFLGWLNKVMS